MPMLAVRVLRKISVGLNPGMKYLLRPKRKKVIDAKQVAERIAETYAFFKGGCSWYFDSVWNHFEMGVAGG